MMIKEIMITCLHFYDAYLYYHFGTGTPAWRNGPPEKPVLCNACGTRYRKKGTLEHYAPKGAQGQPVVERQKNNSFKAKSSLESEISNPHNCFNKNEEDDGEILN